MRQLLSKLRQISRILWVRVTLILALSLIAALLTPLFESLIPDGYTERFSEDATLPILTILANSMLAVTTFSLSIMAATHRFTAQQTTPRIHRLLLDDTRTQSVLATFIGAFVFALTAIILFRANYYADSTSVIVFFMTVLVVAIVVISIVRWIDHLSQLGSMDYALARAEESAKETLANLRHSPGLGAHPMAHDTPVPSGCQPIKAPASGYLREINLDGLNAAAKQHDATIYVTTLPGDTVLASQTLAHAKGHDATDVFAEFFTLSDHRAHEQDARYAVQSLRETASKALSPGINDPGTAIDVTVRLERLLWDWLRDDRDEDDVDYPQIYVRRLTCGVLLRTAFIDIARDGAGFVDVLGRVHVALRAIQEVAPAEDRDTATALMDQVSAYAEKGLQTEAEQARFKAIVSDAA